MVKGIMSVNSELYAASTVKRRVSSSPVQEVGTHAHAITALIYKHYLYAVPKEAQEGIAGRGKSKKLPATR
jgi:hypothetical protein